MWINKRIVIGVGLAVVLVGCGGTAEDVGGSKTVTTSTQAPPTSAPTKKAQVTTTTEAPTTTKTPTTTETTTTTATVVVELAGLQLTEVVFGDHVTITNNTDQEVSLDGMWLCNRPTYFGLSGSLAPGESIEIAADDLRGIAAGGGEVGFYASRSFGDSSAMTDYVAWGGGGGRESVAVEAGLWTDGDKAPSDGGAITRTDEASGAGSWESS